MYGGPDKKEKETETWEIVQEYVLFGEPFAKHSFCCREKGSWDITGIILFEIKNFILINMAIISWNYDLFFVWYKNLVKVGTFWSDSLFEGPGSAH